MFWYSKFFMKMDKAGEGGGGGGGGGTPPAATDHAKEIAELKASNASMLAAIEKLTKAGAPPEKKDPPAGGEPEDLETKARKEREAKAAAGADSKKLEEALRFSLGAKDWLKSNASLLPKDMEGIFTAAEKETYGTAMEKDQAIKSGLIQSFFKVQANLDLLTEGPKSDLEDWLKLTKNGKEEKAQQIFKSVFEPALEMLKRVKKAEQLNQGGHVNSSEVDAAYKDRLMKKSRQQYTGEKADA
jgi:hypothetical protein